MFRRFEAHCLAMADKSMVEYSDYAMESTGLTGMVSSGFPEIAGERNENEKEKAKRADLCLPYLLSCICCLFKGTDASKGNARKGGSGAEHDVERLWQPEGACRKKRSV